MAVSYCRKNAAMCSAVLPVDVKQCMYGLVNIRTYVHAQTHTYMNMRAHRHTELTFLVGHVDINLGMLEQLLQHTGVAVARSNVQQRSTLGVL